MMIAHGESTSVRVRIAGSDENRGNPYIARMALRSVALCASSARVGLARHNQFRSKTGTPAWSGCPVSFDGFVTAC